MNVRRREIGQRVCERWRHADFARQVPVQLGGKVSVTSITPMSPS
jgi:hypothetical protein